MPENALDLESELVQDIASFVWDPLGYVRYAFPWGEPGTLADYDGPRDWQEDELREIGEHLSHPNRRYTPLQLAVASGHSIGKSALIAMIIKWGLDTHEDTRIVVTSNTETQLRTKTVPEVTKWHNLSLTSHWYSNSATSITSNEPGHDKSWRADFIPWSKDNSEAFAGLHNKGKRIIVLFDEASAIADRIWEVTEGALIDEETEIIWIAFGNPTRNIGRFRECFRKFSKYWKTRQIDARDVPGTNKAFIQQLIDQYGENSDIVKVRVKGQFPSQSARQLYPQELLDGAWGKHLRHDQYDFAPKIIAVDPAWEGDDEFVIGMRQGLHFKILATYAKNSNDIEMAQRIASFEDDENADMVFIDGGYGTGIVSAGRTMGRNWQLVWFNGASGRLDCLNKRAEMYLNVSDLMREGLAIPKDQELYDELLCQETVPRLDGKYQLPPKHIIKESLGRSPNKSDCLAITTAQPVVKKRTIGLKSKQRKSISEYNPLHDRLKREK